MANEAENITEREEIEMLLPWFATGRLETHEAQRVEAYLVQHPEMRRQVELIRDEQHATIIANEALKGPAPGGLDRLRQSIAREATPLDKARAGLGGWLKEMSRLFTSPTPSAVRWAGAAAVALMLVQAAFIGTLVSQRGPAKPNYTTASGETAAAVRGTRVLIRFAASAEAGQIADVLAAAGAEIVGGPKPGGLFEVRLSKDELKDTERDALIDKLKANEGLIELVVPHG
jgi:anti-sigma factor RsiW